MHTHIHTHTPIHTLTHAYIHTYTHTHTLLPQYVEKLDKLVRFCIKEKVLSLEDLDRIWAAQDGKHEIIVKNIHDMLVKLAWDFSPEQLDYLFGCFQVCAAVSCVNTPGESGPLTVVHIAVVSSCK